MKELYAQYGELLVKAEIINNQIQECKKKIADELNKLQTQPKIEEVKGDEIIKE